MIDIPPGDKRVTHFILELSVAKPPDSEVLAIFAKVVQTHSFVGAAAELRLSKATVSKVISRIERKLGARLFNRAARGLAVTEAGRQLYDRAARILAEGEAVEDDGMAQSTAPRSHVRLTAPMSYGLVRVARIRPEFLERYPAVTIDLHLSDSHVSGRDTTPPFASHPCRILP